MSKITAIEIDGIRYIPTETDCQTCGVCDLIDFCRENLLFAHICHDTQNKNTTWKRE